VHNIACQCNECAVVAISTPQAVALAIAIVTE
jgi:hypothetical protein